MVMSNIAWEVEGGAMNPECQRWAGDHWELRGWQATSSEVGE